MHSKTLHLKDIYLTSDRTRPIVDVLQMSKHLKIRLPDVNTHQIDLCYLRLMLGESAVGYLNCIQSCEVEKQGDVFTNTILFLNVNLWESSHV